MLAVAANQGARYRDMQTPRFHTRIGPKHALFVIELA